MLARGTVRCCPFDLEVTHPQTLKSTKFQSLHFGESPKRNSRLFTPITVAGRSSFTDVVLFLCPFSRIICRGNRRRRAPAAFQTDVKCGYRRWLAGDEGAGAVFDMTADYIQSHNKNGSRVNQPISTICAGQKRWPRPLTTREADPTGARSGARQERFADDRNAGPASRRNSTGRGYRPALSRFSASGYCDAALEGIRRVCEDALGKDAVKQKIKSMTCGFGGERAISLKDGSLAYTINFNSTNNADFVYAYLQNNL